MFQNPNMAYYTMNLQTGRPIDPSNPMQYTFQQSQAQRVLYQYGLNNMIPPQVQPQIQIQNQIKNIPYQNQNLSNQITNASINPQNNQNNTIQDKATTNAESNTSNNIQNTQSNSQPLNLLTKYKDIYVPTIYLLDYNDISKSPFNILAANNAQTQNQTYNQLTGKIISNNKNNSVLNKYLNYDYNFDQWKAYVNEIKAKFDELNDLVKDGKIRLPEPDNELEYLMAFPSDYGGLGKVQNDQNYENVKFYDPKDTTKNQANKDFMSLIHFDHDQTWFALEPNPQSLNKQINDYNKIINPSYLNYYFPQNFFNRNQNNIPSAIISNPEQNNNGNNSNNKSEPEKSKAER